MHAHVPKFLLRWKFEWNDRPSKFGMWSLPGSTDDLATKAWCSNREGLKTAIIESKDYVTREIKTVVAVSGQDFMNFQWVALASVNVNSVKGKTTPRTIIGGLKIITRHEEITAFDFGKVTRAKNSVENINFATYGK